MHLHHILHCLQWSSSLRTDPSDDLVLDLYFRDTTWDSCDMHYLDYIIFFDLPYDFNLWFCVLVIFWSCYMIFTHPGYPIFIIFMSRHACMEYYTWFIILSIRVIVLDTAKHIVLLSWYPICTIIMLSCSYFYYPFFHVYTWWSGSDGLILIFNV